MTIAAIFENRRIRVRDIYKYNIPVDGSFTCNECGKKISISPK